MPGLQILGVVVTRGGVQLRDDDHQHARAPGMNLMRMPMFTWMAFVTQFLLILAFPVITIALVFLQFDRFFGTNFYAMGAGADPLLGSTSLGVWSPWEVYILILPAFGLTSEVPPVVLAQTDLRISRDGLFGNFYRLPRLRRLGSPTCSPWAWVRSPTRCSR